MFIFILNNKNKFIVYIYTSFSCQKENPAYFRQWKQNLRIESTLFREEMFYLLILAMIFHY